MYPVHTRTLNFEGHGNVGFQNISSTVDPARKTDGRIGIRNKTPFGFELFEGVDFCRPCKIVFRGCLVGDSIGIIFLQWVADATGCEVSGWSSMGIPQPGERTEVPPKTGTLGVRVYRKSLGLVGGCVTHVHPKMLPQDVDIRFERLSSACHASLARWSMPQRIRD